jgi:replicative DNA helicase
MTDRLSSYGYAFQIKVITSLLTDKSFLQQIADIMNPKYFESDANNWIVQTILDYQKEYKASPTLEVMKVKMEKVDHDVLKEQIVAHLKDAWKFTESTDLEYIKDQALDFCKNQEIKKAILGSVELLKNGDYEGIKVTVDNALKAGADKDIGHDYMTSIEERYTDAVRHVQPTPWEVINELTDGGLGKGELGVMVAPAGIGKSWALMNIGADAVKKGKKVLHYTLELNEAYVGLRYDSVICIMQGKKPDVIIVDYADLLRGHGQEKRHELEGIYEDLRGMAGEYEIPVWTASQANRSALEEDVIDASKVSESYGKVMVADFVLSLSRKVQDKLAGTGRWHVIKNRFGPDGITLPSKMNTSNGQFNIYTDTSIQGQNTQKQMDKGDNMARALLARKYQETQNEGFE